MVPEGSRDHVLNSKKAQPVKKFAAGNKDKEVFGSVLMEVDQFIWCGCSDGIIRLWDTKVCGEDCIVLRSPST